MAYRLLHKKSCVSGKTPTAAQLEYGELAINFNPNSPKLYFKDSGDTIVSFIDEKKINNLLSSEITNLEDKLTSDITTLNNDLSTDITNLDNKLTAQTKTLETEISNLESNLTSNIDDLSTQITTLNNDLTAQTKTLETEISSLNSNLKLDITNLSAQTIALEKTVSEQTENINSKQEQLVSGTNIKTINGNSILGSGNVTIDSVKYKQGDGIIIENDNTIKINTDIVALKDDVTFNVNQALDYVQLDCDGNVKILAATDTQAGVMTAEDKYMLNCLVDEINEIINNGISGGTSASTSNEIIEWDYSLNLNDYIKDGTYIIKGIRESNLNDNLPFNNVGENASFVAKLIVMVSPQGKTVYRHIVGQTLILANAEGHETKIYTRSGNRTSLNYGDDYVVDFGEWSTMQSNREVGPVDNLDNFIDNGIYSGVWRTGGTSGYPLTFVCITINDYALGKNPRNVSQFVYGLSKADGSVTYQTRMGEGDTTIEWGAWKGINEDSIQEIRDLINTEIQNLGEYISQVQESVNETKNDLTETKKNIASSLHASSIADSVKIVGKSDVGRITFSVDIPAATSGTSGVMSSTDKTNLDNLVGQFIDFPFIISQGLDNVELRCDGKLTISAATSGTAGVMSSTDKIHLDYLYENFDDNTFNIAQLSDYVQLRCDGLTISAATETEAGVMTAEDKKNLDYLYKQFDDIINNGISGGTSASNEIIEWDSSLNLNDYIEDGTYIIKGIRKSDQNDNLPFNNVGENASFVAKLIVMVSPQGDTVYRHIVGQTLILANAEGHETKIYTRSGNRTSYNYGDVYVTEFSEWSTMQSNREVGLVGSLDDFIDNGIYSGVWNTGGTSGYPLTFVCITINDYALGGNPRRVSQFVYGLSKADGSVTYQTRTGEGDTTINWGVWKGINEDSIQEISDRIRTLGAEARKMDASIKTLATDIDNERNARTNETSDIKEYALQYNTLGFSPTAEKLSVYGKALDGQGTLKVDIPAATSGTAGVMSAEDKMMLDYLVDEINDIINNGIGTSGMTSALTNTNFTIEQNSNNQIIFKFDDGKKQFISAATETKAGVMSATDKININKINTLESSISVHTEALTIINNSAIGNSVNFSASTNDLKFNYKNIIGTISGSTTIPLATSGTAGVMSSTDKTNLDRINHWYGANINVRDELSASIEAEQVARTNDFDYLKANIIKAGTLGFSYDNNKVELFGKELSGDTIFTKTISAATETQAGVMTSEDKKKLNNLKNINLTVDGTTLIIE